jgi:hypothetical protein
VTPRTFTTHLMIATDDVIAHFTVAVHADGTATVEAAKLGPVWSDKITQDQLGRFDFDGYLTALGRGLVARAEAP